MIWLILGVLALWAALRLAFEVQVYRGPFRRATDPPHYKDGHEHVSAAVYCKLWRKPGADQDHTAERRT